MLARRRLLVLLAVMPGWLLVAACGSSGGSPTTHSFPAASIPSASTAGAASELRDWTEFGLDPQRSDATESPTGITAANVGHLSRITVHLPGTVDSSPVYLHGVSVAGAQHDVIVVTTTYGKTLAIDADSGRILWTFTPSGYDSWAGSYQISTTSPLADPDREFVYTASPDGLVHKLSLATGSEQRAAAGRPGSRSNRGARSSRRHSTPTARTCWWRPAATSATRLRIRVTWWCWNAPAAGGWRSSTRCAPTAATYRCPAAARRATRRSCPGPGRWSSPAGGGS